MTNNRDYRQQAHYYMYTHHMYDGYTAFKEDFDHANRAHMQALMSHGEPIESLQRLFPQLIVATSPDPKTHAFRITNVTNKENTHD